MAHGGNFGKSFANFPCTLILKSLAMRGFLIGTQLIFDGV
jgi:hypothetical protein